MPYLLTPGPLTTSRTVKHAMLADWGSRDIEFRYLVGDIRQRLLRLAGALDGYECVLMQGSGTFAIEAALGGFAPTGKGKRKTLVVINGAYGERCARILDRLGRPTVTLDISDSRAPSPEELAEATDADQTIATVVVVHCETTSGIINPLPELAAAVKSRGKTLIVDAMSSFGAIPLDMAEMGIDVMVSSSNKCIEGAPGFGYVICRRDLLEASKGQSHSVALDLHDQWQAMEKNGQFRFTPPTHTLAAFHQALMEHASEGGVKARGARYWTNRDVLVAAMRDLGFETLLSDDQSGPIIQTFLTPADPNFSFEPFYEALRLRGFAIYPGKLTKRDTFRIGTIGQIDEAVMRQAVAAIRDVMAEMGVTSGAPAPIQRADV
ncbi:MAG: 2-aminoethylphosphonate--pyruvate transaminase [Hyphomicrobiales bacterium]